MVVGDADADGDVDIVVARREADASSSLYAYWNTGGGSFREVKLGVTGATVIT